MRTRSLLTVLACTAVLTGAAAESAFADSTSGQPTAAPTTDAAAATPTAVPSVPSTPPGPPTAVTTRPSPVPSSSTRPSTLGTPPPPMPSVPGDSQITAVPSGAPNTGVAAAASDGHGEAAVAGASLAVLLGGSGTLALRRKLKGRG